ncbi:MAG: type II secretion system protein J [Sphingobacteriaceae bacterium]
MKGKLKIKVKGNTIVEVLIALTILTICSTLAIRIFLNVTKSNTSFFKLKAIELAEVKLLKSIKDKDFTENITKAEEFTVKQSIKSSEQYQDCICMQITVMDNDLKVVAELKQVVNIYK